MDLIAWILQHVVSTVCRLVRVLRNLRPFGESICLLRWCKLARPRSNSPSFQIQFLDNGSHVSPRPLLVLTLDGLATSALTCYGSSWNQTPAMDAIAASGALWDRWTASSDEPHSLVRLCDRQGSGGWADAWKKTGSVELLTDVPELLAGTANPSFDREETVDSTPVGAAPATEIVETQFARLIAAAIDRDNEDDPWSLMWLHSDFLTRCWDAPRELFPIDEIELALAPNSEAELLELELEGSEPVESMAPIFDSVAPPELQIETPAHPDLVVAWMRTYGCQVRLVDLLVEILLQSISVDDPQIIIAGTSGYRLGQGGWIGHRVGPLRSPDIRLPLIVSDQGPIRVPQLCSTDRLPDILLALSQETGLVPADQWSVQGTTQRIETSSSRAKQAITTPSWFCVQDPDSSEHLFLKPDDVEDFNNVGRVRTDVVQELLGRSSE